MSETLIAALVGALVGGSFALLGSVIQHFLSLREDRIKRAREEEQKRREAIREALRPSLINQKEVEKLLTYHSLSNIGIKVTKEEREKLEKSLADIVEEMLAANSEPATETGDKIDDEWVDTD